MQATRWTGTSCFKTMRRAQATGHGENESPGQIEGEREGPRLSIEVPARDTGWTGRSGHPPRALGSLSLTPRGLGAEGAPLPAERWEVVSGQWEVLAPRPGLGGTRGAGRGGAGLPGAGPPLSSPAAAEPQPGLSCFLLCRRARRRRPPPPPATLNMEPPDARAGARRGPRLLVLALLLGAHRGMARAESRARLRRGPWGTPGREEGRGFYQPRKPNLGTPGRRDMGAWGAPPSERHGDSQAEGLGIHCSGLEAT